MKTSILVALVMIGVAGLTAQTIAIKAGNLIDPSSGKVMKDQTILIKEKHIVEVGGTVAVPPDARVIDLSRSWVLPGLMDAHVHLTFNLPPGHSLVSSYLREGSALRALLGAHNAKLVLEAGFTTVKDIGNDANYAAVDLRRAIEQGWISGPTMLTTGKIIAAFGGQSRNIPPEQGPFWQFEYIDADTPDEIRKAIRQNIYYGANAIKLVADNSRYFYSLDEIKAAVDEAHRAGVTIAIHTMGGQAATNVIMGGADAIEHGFYLTDEHLKMMKEEGTFLVGTDFPEEHLKAMNYGGPDMPRKIIDRLRRAYQMGVKMAYGTDVVVDLPGKNRAQMNLDFLETWKAAGIPPAHILRCMTTNAAELFRMQSERGAVKPGFFADIIATDGNPLDNIDALHSVRFVMKEGEVVKE